MTKAHKSRRYIEINIKMKNLIQNNNKYYNII